MYTSPNLRDVVDAHDRYLTVKYPEARKAFAQLKKHGPDAARAEAVLFATMCSAGLSVVPSESVAGGGPDFLCSSGGSRFLLEVTSLDAEKTKEKSGLELNPKGDWFSFITGRLWKKVQDKTKQTSQAEIPSVLAITSSFAGGLLLGRMAAEKLIHGEPMIRVPLNTERFESDETADLKESAFLSLGTDGKVRYERPGISAILLVAIEDNGCCIVGCLNPRPKHPFDINLLQDIPFVRPILCEESATLNTEWVVGRPHVPAFHYQPMVLTEDDLRNPPG